MAHRLVSSVSPSRAPLHLLVITISRIHGVIVFAVGAYEGKTVMNGTSEWMNQGECIRIRRRRRVSSRAEGREEQEQNESKREREREAGPSNGFRDRSTMVHPARRVYKLSNLVDKSVPGLFFSALGVHSLSFLAGVYRCIHVARKRQLSKSRVGFIKFL